MKFATKRYITHLTLGMLLHVVFIIVILTIIENAPITERH